MSWNSFMEDIDFKSWVLKGWKGSFGQRIGSWIEIVIIIKESWKINLEEGKNMEYLGDIEVVKNEKVFMGFEC